jgi:hypothetical protein
MDGIRIRAGGGTREAVTPDGAGNPLDPPSSGRTVGGTSGISVADGELRAVGCALVDCAERAAEPHAIVAPAMTSARRTRDGRLPVLATLESPTVKSSPAMS